MTIWQRNSNKSNKVVDAFMACGIAMVSLFVVDTIDGLATGRCLDTKSLIMNLRAIDGSKM